MANLGKPALPSVLSKSSIKPPIGTVRDLGGYIREQRNNAQISVRQLAAQAGVSNPYLSQIERGLRHPSAEILQQIAKALRISAEALYVQAGILDERSVGNDTTSAILADPGLTERQKQALLEIYASFRDAEPTEPTEPTGSPEPSQPAHHSATHPHHHPARTDQEA